MWGPTVPVGLSSFVFPFDAAEAIFGGCFADLLEVLAGGFWIELGSRGAWMSGEPVLHVGLVLIFGGLVFEDVEDLAYFLMVWRSCWVVPLGGGTWDAEGVPKESVFVRAGGWEAGHAGA